MSTQEFFDKYNNKFIDYDGVWGFQCTDLIRQYIKEVLGLNPYVAIPQTGAAKNIFNNFPAGGNKYFTKVLNGPTNAPKQGDLVFWGTYPFVTGWAGHTAICESAGTMNLITFDQNFGSVKSCRFVKHSYKGIGGWLAPRKQAL